MVPFLLLLKTVESKSQSDIAQAIVRITINNTGFASTLYKQ